MLEVFKESDVYTALMKMYALYPYNDMAHRYVTNIVCYGLEPKLAKKLLEKSIASKGRPSRILDLEPINKTDDQANEQADNMEIENE